MNYLPFQAMQSQFDQGQPTMHPGCYGALQHMASQLCAAGQHMTTQANYFQDQLRNADYELQNTKQEFQGEKQDLEEELDRERKTSEESIQGHRSKETECDELQKEVRVLHQKLEETTTYWSYAEQVAKEAGNTLQAMLPQDAAHKSLDIGEFLIECGRSTALLQMSKSGPDEQVMRYNRILEHNAKHQKRITELLKRNEELSQQLGSKDTEALDIDTEEGSPHRRKKSSRNTAKLIVKTETPA